MLLNTTVWYGNKYSGIIPVSVHIDLIEPVDSLDAETKNKAIEIIKKIDIDSAYLRFGGEYDPTYRETMLYEDFAELVDKYYEVIGVKNPHKDNLDDIKNTDNPFELI